MKDLLDEHAQLAVYDPEVKRDQMLVEFDYTLAVNTSTYPQLHNMITTSATAMEAATGAHAVCILTEWDEFAKYDYHKIYEVMAKPAFIFDGRNILNHTALREIGFEVYAIGKTHQKIF
jgi:UDPglucose 6-dehydrogenase